jgi:hypothetical protein
MIKTNRIEFTEILDARFTDRAAAHVAIDLHTIGCEANSIATVAIKHLEKAKAEDRPEWEETFSCSLVLDWMERIQGQVQKALQHSLENQTK